MNSAEEEKEQEKQIVKVGKIILSFIDEFIGAGLGYSRFCPYICAIKLNQ